MSAAERLSAWLSLRSARERGLLAVMLVVVLGGAVWAGVISPLRDSVGRAQADLEEARTEARWVARESRAFADIPRVQALEPEALRQSLAAHGLAGALEGIAVSGETVELVLNGVGYAALMEWLEASGALLHRLRVTSLPDGGVRAEITFAPAP